MQVFLLPDVCVYIILGQNIMHYFLLDVNLSHDQYNRFYDV